MGPKVRRLTLVYKEGKEAIVRHVIDYLFYGLHDYCAFFNCVVEIVVSLSIRCSRVGIPSPFLRGLLGELSLHFSTLRLKAKASVFIYSVISAENSVVLQGVAVEG